jgi:hypothetical protein
MHDGNLAVFFAESTLEVKNVTKIIIVHAFLIWVCLIGLMLAASNLPRAGGFRSLCRI